MRIHVLKSCAAILSAVLIWNLIVGLTTVRLPRILRDGPFGQQYQPKSLHVHGTEGFAWLRHDEYGYNNRPGLISGRSDGAGSPAIVILGDSFTEALQVPRSRNFCSLLEEKLRKRNQEISVVNLGVSGRSMCDAIVFSEAILERLKPSHVVVQCRIDDWLEDATDSGKDYSLRKIDGEIGIAANQSAHQTLKEVKDRVITLAPLLSWSYLRVRTVERSPRNWLPGNFRRPKGTPEPLSAVAQQSRSADARELIDWQIGQLVDRYGAGRLTLLYIDEISLPDALRHQPSDSAVTTYLLEQCGKHGVDVIRTRDAFLKALREKSVVPTGFANSVPGRGHLNATGHQMVAELLSQYFAGP